MLKAIFNIRAAMYVCLCKGVSDRAIKKLVDEGVSSVAEVMRCTGAGTKCGSCISEIACLVEDEGEGGPAGSPRRTLPVVPSGAAA
jgi:bacterioferritin-associated ferredoxin